MPPTYEYPPPAPGQLEAIREADATLRSLGFLPISWWHPETHLLVHEERTCEPRFVVVDYADNEEHSTAADMKETVGRVTMASLAPQGVV